MSPQPLPTVERLREVFNYYPLSGQLVWRELEGAAMWNSRYAGRDAGTVMESGHVRVVVDGRCLLASRIAWKMVTGEEPPARVVHVNKIKGDNRFLNLKAG